MEGVKVNLDRKFQLLYEIHMHNDSTWMIKTNLELFCLITYVFAKILNPRHWFESFEDKFAI